MNKHAPELHRFQEAQKVHCVVCVRTRVRRRWMAGISGAAIAGCLIALYVAYERNTISFERIGRVMTWVVERDKQEKALHAKLDAIAKRLEEAEKRAIETQRALRLATVCPRDLRGPGAPIWPKYWAVPGAR